MKKIIERFFSAISEFFEMIFFSAAENQILISHRGKEQKKFYSYTQLKKYQKKMRKFALMLFLGAIFFVVGIVIGPTIFPKTVRSEVYIPNGRGDVLIGNVSKSQATLIFKTLDAENDFKPLATKAFVEVCADQSCEKILRTTDKDDYAVTHIISIDSLEEGKTYYFRITASDSSSFANSKSISSWGDGLDPIKVLTTGDAAPVCLGQNEIRNTPTLISNNASPENISNNAIENIPSISSAEELGKKQDLKLNITNVQSENYLQPKNKVQTIISWNTNVPANSILLYSEGEKGEKKELVISEEKKMKHAAILTTFKAGTIYYFEAKSQDEKGNIAVSGEYSLHTPRPKANVLKAIVDNMEALIRQIKPR